MSISCAMTKHASSRGKRANSGNGPTFQLVDIDHPEYVGLVEPDCAFWSLVKKEMVGDLFCDKKLLEAYRVKAELFHKEMNDFRFGLKPSAVYFNPTDRCNLNCSYCYIPERMRSSGQHMSTETMFQALERLSAFFDATLPKDKTPQIIFHGAEPLMNREALFSAIETYRDRFYFGVQTNGTLLDTEAVSFFSQNSVGIGLSLDGATAEVADASRFTRDNKGVYGVVTAAIKRLRGYENFNVISTVTKKNMAHLPELVAFFHAVGVPVCMLNPVRCTLEGGQKAKPLDHDMAPYYLEALDKCYDLYQKSGNKLVVANFANVLLGIIAPTARRLMCDISPCGGGRCFFAVAANGDLFPCSEFIGLAEFKSGNLFDERWEDVLTSVPFKQVTERKVEDIEPCATCAVRHFCGSPCPAEAFVSSGKMNTPGAFCELYEEQVRYALRLLADKKTDAYLWDGWDDDVVTSFVY